MLKIYYVENKQQWSDEQYEQLIQMLPSDMRDKISAYKNWKDRQSRVIGKWMLMKMLAYFELDLKLDDLKYTEFNKPYFNQHFTFSIAHSGDLVVCAGDLDTEIGIDIEQIVPMELIDYKDQLTIDEWNFIHQSIDKQRTFYDIWTKKEALLKAIGRGMDVELNTLDVYADTARYEGKNYWFYPLEIAEDHIAYLATSAPSDSVSISSERLSDLL